MNFSDDRIFHLAHLIRDTLVRSGVAECADEDKALNNIKKTLIEYFRVEDEADQAAREKIGTLKKNVPEGSREWDVLYRKYLEEEMVKRGR